MQTPNPLLPLDAEAREVRCFYCGTTLEVPPDAVSLLCTGCGKNNDMASYSIESTHNRQIQTHGEVVIGVRGKYHGPRISAGRLVVAGVLEAVFQCEELVLGKVGHVAQVGEARTLIILPQTRVRLPQPIALHDAFISGFLEVSEIRASGLLVVHRGGHLRATVFARAIRVEELGRFEGDLEVSPDTPQPPA